MAPTGRSPCAAAPCLPSGPASGRGIGEGGLTAITEGGLSRGEATGSPSSTPAIREEATLARSRPSEDGRPEVAAAEEERSRMETTEEILRSLAPARRLVSPTVVCRAATVAPLERRRRRPSDDGTVGLALRAIVTGVAGRLYGPGSRSV